MRACAHSLFPAWTSLTTRQRAHRSIVHLLLTVVGITGIVGLFLPFADSTSPVDAVSDRELWRLALPFFLAVLVSAASIRWVISGSFSRPERAIAYVVSASMVGVTLSLLLEDRPATIQDWLGFVIAGVILGLGGYILIRNSRMGPSREIQSSDGDPDGLSRQRCAMPDLVLWRLGAGCVLRPGSRAYVCVSDRLGLCTWN